MFVFKHLRILCFIFKRLQCALKLVINDSYREVQIFPLLFITKCSKNYRSFTCRYMERKRLKVTGEFPIFEGN